MLTYELLIILRPTSTTSHMAPDSLDDLQLAVLEMLDFLLAILGSSFALSAHHLFDRIDSATYGKY